MLTVFSRASLPAAAVCAALFLLSCVVRINALYFYLAPGEDMSFYETIQKNTFVMMNYTASVEGPNGTFVEVDPKTNVMFTVHETDPNGTEAHKLLSQKAGLNGRFFFTSGTSATHKLTVNGCDSNGNAVHPRMKISTEILLGKSGNPDVISHTEANINKLEDFVSELLNEVHTIRREQENFGYRQEEFKILSNDVNSSIKYICFIQIVIILIASFWQYRNMRAFFKSKKLA